MKIERIRITNVKNIDSLDISLIDENTGNPHNVLLLVGENGSGKTTILQSVVSCLTANRVHYGGKKLEQQDITVNESMATVLLDVVFDSEETNRYSENGKGCLKQFITKDGAKYNGEEVRSGNSSYLNHVTRGGMIEQPTIGFGTEPIIGGYVLFFDAYRLVPDNKIMGPNNNNPKSPIQDSLKTSTQGNYSDRFQYTKQWLVNLDYKEAKLYREKQADSGLMNQVVESFNLLLAPYSFARISPNSEILFNTSKGEVDVNALSDGMKSIFSMIGDMLFRFSLSYMDEDSIDVSAVLNTEAIVLIDEIDCHLHPKWQLNIIPALRKLFPNVQFIMTTHSPLIVKSVEPHEVVKIGGLEE